MSQESIQESIATVLAYLACILWGIAMGIAIASHVERGRAIKAGVGRWAVDPTTGDTRFVYGAAGSVKDTAK